MVSYYLWRLLTTKQWRIRSHNLLFKKRKAVVVIVIKQSVWSQYSLIIFLVSQWARHKVSKSQNYIQVGNRNHSSLENGVAECSFCCDVKSVMPAWRTHNWLINDGEHFILSFACEFITWSITKLHAWVIVKERNRAFSLQIMVQGDKKSVIW